jgi:hypothetical protein
MRVTTRGLGPRHRHWAQAAALRTALLSADRARGFFIVRKNQKAKLLYIYTYTYTYLLAKKTHTQQRTAAPAHGEAHDAYTCTLSFAVGCQAV